jgi:predicted ATPase
VWIKSFNLTNFKSFETTATVRLDRHINVIVGQNHAGKTTLLNALALRITSKPHNSSKYRVGEARDPTSWIDLSFEMSGLELRDYLASYNSSTSFPIPSDWVVEAGEDQNKLLVRAFALEEIEFFVRRNAPAGGAHWAQTKYPSNNLEGSSSTFMQIVRPNDTADLQISQVSSTQSDNAATVVADNLVRKTYYFDAQRIPRETYPFGNSEKLITNAENLPEVLAILQSRRTEYLKFVSAVRRVLPAIKWVSVEPSKANGQHAEIRLWNLEEAEGRYDLTLPLSEGGTGVGQVLAILYVVLKSSDNIIIIDEPNSFLHPRAAKELIGILKEDRSNQYIISTHNSEIVVAADPEQYLMLRFNNEKTEVEIAARADLRSARQTLEELGSQLSDVFGADSVVWVEGPTEVQCFPLLLAASNRKALPNVALAPLRNTGDLEGRHAAAIADIYRNLTTSHAIIPTSLALCLDGDKANIANIRELNKAFGAVHFLPRRCYENFLLDVRAMAEALNSFEYFKSKPTSADIVSSWLLKHGTEEKYGAKSHEVLSAEWLKQVDAPKLLDDLFQELSEATETFRKPLHSVQLTTWLLHNDPTALRELAEFVIGIVPNLAD